MDGAAISAALATCPGPDCLKGVLPKLGQRLKVYGALKALYEELQVHIECLQVTSRPYNLRDTVQVTS